MASIVGYTKARIDAIVATLATLASPIFTGTPSLPTGTTAITQAAANNSTKLATTAYADAADNLKAPLASPVFTGTPSLPTGTTGVTQAPGDNTTKLATTGFVAALNSLLAPLASPLFTGTPSLPTGTTGVTQAAGDISTKLATTAFVQGGKTKTVNSQVGTAYTLVLTDAEKVIESSNAAVQTITVPPNSAVAFAIGTIIQLTWIGATKPSFAAGAGVTINSPGALLGCRVQYSTITLRKRGTDLWILSDDVG